MGIKYNILLNIKINKAVKAIESFSSKAEEHIYHAPSKFEYWEKGELYFTPKWNEESKTYEVGTVEYGRHQNTDNQSSKFRTPKEAKEECEVLNTLFKVKRILYENMWDREI